jgi:uroporphyrinogen-III synthase
MRKTKSEHSLTCLVNIGNVTAKKLERIGIYTKEDFLSRDPYEVYTLLLENVDPSLCRCMLASLVGAKKGVPWHTITKKTAEEYQKRNPDHHWKNNC